MAIGRPELGFGSLPLEHDDLISQGEDLGLKITRLWKYTHKDLRDGNNIANMAGEVYADNFNYFIYDGFPGTAILRVVEHLPDIVYIEDGAHIQQQMRLTECC